ncbi:MAG: thiamine-phosphate pyrophosphorylase [Acidobacteriota bacterium]|jgi:thiamine-phosphate pyrophosphorylase|nr:thiamine-phosphate pyrophosphorylase [Acidobacteriota bacterium]
MPLLLPKLYPVTDRLLSGLSHAEQVARLCEGGATFLQLREKHLAPRDFYREAEAALREARTRGARLIINDRADLALALGADGVHLGQDDMPPRAARSLLGAEAIIGFSTHSVEQARAASRLPVDYVAIGPVFATSSKENPEPVIGLEGVRRVREAVGRLHLVAIGGITPESAEAVIEAGADSVALIGALIANAFDPAEIIRRTRLLLARL